jgi:sugar phosphate isomerase/epimerase
MGSISTGVMLISCSTSCIPEREPHSVEHMMSHIDTDHFELFLFNHWGKKGLSRIFSGYPFFSVHGSKQFGFTLEKDIKKGKNLLREDITLAYKVEASTLVLHCYNSLNENPDLDRVLAVLSSAQKCAEEHHVSLSIELIPHIKIPIPELASFFSSHLDKTFFTADLEYTSKFECLDEVLTHVTRINNIHVRDYDGHWIVNGKRKYLKPLDGNLDFDDLFSTIIQSGYKSTFTLEAPHKTVEEVNASMGWLRTSLKTHTSL